MAGVGIAALLSAGAVQAQAANLSSSDLEQSGEQGQVVDEVVVVGVRASIARAVNLKRDAATVQDSISALELGMFPDDNVADSLSHYGRLDLTHRRRRGPKRQCPRPGP
ncbi:hypothetical protein [Brevundimonas nasdae]|uniref:hypothetical protein n=1 Tax=Brevundimonas nasdae TaxID=172043 RepID=UPI003F692DA7